MQIPEFFADSESDRVTGQPFASARQNYFGRVQYNYNDRYLAEFQGRYDGSQNFTSERRFGFLTAFLLGWRISDEPWFKSSATAYTGGCSRDLIALVFPRPVPGS